MVIHAITTCQLKIIWNLVQEHLEDNCNFSSAEKRTASMGGRGVLRISSDRDDQRIFLEIFDSGICLSRKIFASFLGSLIYVEIVLGIQNYLKIYDCYII